jgi:transposase InsO family protein
LAPIGANFAFVCIGERFETIRQAKDAALAWLLWYNWQRMHSPLNYLSLTQFERH